jgi:hypothetical protein
MRKTGKNYRWLAKPLAGLVAATFLGGATLSKAETPTPGFNHEMPESLLTPDSVETSIGTLEFFDGLPTEKTTEMLYNNLERIRGTEAFLNFVPAASLEALRTGLVSMGVSAANDCVLFDRLMTSDSLFLTGNTDTVYAACILDIERDGPTVVEVPAGAGPGTVNDAFFRFVVDMGAPGPDRGKGGKYLILPPDYQGEIPDGYFTAVSPSNVNFLILRGFLKDGKPDAPDAMWRNGLKVYPLAMVEKQPSMNFISGTGNQSNTIHANNYEFFEEIDTVIQREPIDFLDPELRGLLASIGIQKGKKFVPDANTKKILTDAVAIGNATARALTFDSRSETIKIYKDKQWFVAFDGGDYQWLRDKGNGGRDLDARTVFFYIATVNTPAMVLQMVGVGSQYALSARDAAGEYLDGSENYKLTLPADIPAKDFWSVVVYDPQTRSMLQTEQPYPSKNNERNKDLVTNPDGTTDIYFGPKAPAGKEANWIATVPGKAWFLILRLYGPLQSWFDQSWQPGDIEKLS